MNFVIDRQKKNQTENLEKHIFFNYADAISIQFNRQTNWSLDHSLTFHRIPTTKEMHFRLRKHTHTSQSAMHAISGLTTRHLTLQIQSVTESPSLDVVPLSCPCFFPSTGAKFLICIRHHHGISFIPCCCISHTPLARDCARGQTGLFSRKRKL